MHITKIEAIPVRIPLKPDEEQELDDAFQQVIGA